MNLGIVQLIGQAIRKRKLTKPQDRITAISVCNFGYVKNIVDFQRFEHLDTTQPLLTREEQNFVNFCCFFFFIEIFF